MSTVTLSRGYVDYDPDGGRYSLAPEQAVALTDSTSPAYRPGFFQLAPGSVIDAPARPTNWVGRCARLARPTITPPGRPCVATGSLAGVVAVLRRAPRCALRLEGAGKCAQRRDVLGVIIWWLVV